MKMVLEDEDFIIRQVQQLAKGLGKFLGIDAIKDILQLDQDEEGQLSDEEIETIVLITNIEEIQKNRGLSLEELSDEIGLPVRELEKLYSNEKFADEEELEKMRRFVEEHDLWLD